MADQAIRSSHDLRRASPIFNKLEKLRCKMFAKSRDLPVAGAGPLIDDLIIIRDGKYIAKIISGQESHRADTVPAKYPEIHR